MKKASSFLSYFEPFLGRIEIQGSAGRIERVYFEIKESNIEQWTKPQIRESKRQFLFDIVNESDEKEKLENFVNFCEDTIFEMQHAASISPEPVEDYSTPREDRPSLLKRTAEWAKWLLFSLFAVLSPVYLQSLVDSVRNSSRRELLLFTFRLFVNMFFFSTRLVYSAVEFSLRCVYVIVSENHQNARAAATTADELLTDPVATGLTPSHHTGGGHTTPAKPFGFSRAATMDVSDSGEGLPAELAAIAGHEMEVYADGSAASGGSGAAPAASASTATAAGSAATASAEISGDAKPKINYQKLLEEAALAEDQPAENAKAAAAASAASKTSNYKVGLFHLFLLNIKSLQFIIKLE
jgi:hypothetical protein